MRLTSDTSGGRDPLRPMKIMAVANIILLSVQSWSGGVVNLFAMFPSGAVGSLGDAVQALQSAGPGPLAIWHGLEGVLIVLLGIGVAVSALWRRSPRSVKVVSLLALFFILVAALGGYLFVFSGFRDNGSSAQMGGSFIGAYAMSFLTLYFSK